MLLDSYAWIEFFQASEKGKRVEQILSSKKCYTSIVSVSEVIEWCLKNSRDYQDRISRMERLSQIIPLNKKIVMLSGKINFEHKKKIKGWGMMDSMIYSTAVIYGLRVLTGDQHFKKLDNAEML